MTQGKRIYKTANGKHVDLDLLISRNELTPAVGNAKVNARGDELGPGGKIVRKREEVLKDYYNSAPGMVDEAIKKSPKEAPVTNTVAVNAPTAKEMADWEEDDDGNFVKKTTRRGKNESNNESN
jgi:hypothetical protein